MNDPRPAKPADKPPRGVGKNRKSTHQRLWIAMLLVNVLGLFASVFIAQRLRSLSMEPTYEFFLYGLYYAWMAAAALVDALWADEIFFRGAFRKTHLSGLTAKVAQNRGDVEDMLATSRPMHFIFPVLFILGFALSYLLFNLITRDLSGDYDRVGRHARVIRGTSLDQREQRLAAIDALSMVQRPQVQIFLARQLEHDDEESAAFAAWAMGRIRDDNMRRMLSDELMKAARSKRPKVAREAALALARMQHRPVARLIENALRDSIDDPELDLRLIWAMAFLQRPSAVDLLQKAIFRPDIKSQRIAAFALAQQKQKDSVQRSLAILSERIPSASIQTRCAIVHALGILGHEGGNLAILEAWRGASPEERQSYCRPEELRLRPDGQGDDIHKLFVTPIKHTVESFEVLALFSLGAIRATQASVRAEIEPWLESLIQNPDTVERSRQGASSLLKGIRNENPTP